MAVASFDGIAPVTGKSCEGTDHRKCRITALRHVIEGIANGPGESCLRTPPDVGREQAFQVDPKWNVDGSTA
jgi:hypothetical protein